MIGTTTRRVMIGPPTCVNLVHGVLTNIQTGTAVQLVPWIQILFFDGDGREFVQRERIVIDDFFITNRIVVRRQRTRSRGIVGHDNRRSQPQRRIQIILTPLQFMRRIGFNPTRAIRRTGVRVRTV